MDALDPRHGTRPGYYAHRRAGQEACQPCRRAAAKAEAVRQLRLMRGDRGRIPALGTARRLQALAWLGWTWKQLERELGSDEMMVRRWALRTNPGQFVFPDTARRVAELYERLCMTPAPRDTVAQRNAYARAHNRALRNGWMPPLAWDDIDNDPTPPTVEKAPDELDHAVVQRILSGERIPSTPAEKAEAVRVWVASGRSIRDLEHITGWRATRYYRMGKAA